MISHHFNPLCLRHFNLEEGNYTCCRVTENLLTTCFSIFWPYIPEQHFGERHCAAPCCPCHCSSMCCAYIAPLPLEPMWRGPSCSPLCRDIALHLAVSVPRPLRSELGPLITYGLTRLLQNSWDPHRRAVPDPAHILCSRRCAVSLPALRVPLQRLCVPCTAGRARTPSTHCHRLTSHRRWLRRLYGGARLHLRVRGDRPPSAHSTPRVPHVRLAAGCPVLSPGFRRAPLVAAATRRPPGMRAGRRKSEPGTARSMPALPAGRQWPPRRPLLPAHRFLPSQTGATEGKRRAAASVSLPFSSDALCAAAGLLLQYVAAPSPAPPRRSAPRRWPGAAAVQALGPAPRLAAAQARAALLREGRRAPRVRGGTGTPTADRQRLTANG